MAWFPSFINKQAQKGNKNPEIQINGECSNKLFHDIMIRGKR